MSEKVCAVIVTYNRKALLRECLQALKTQTRKPDHVLVVDNASTDGTLGMLEAEFPEVEVLKMPRNEGGAGGFYEGMKWGYERGFDWLWLMDDDTIAKADALAELDSASRALRSYLGQPLLLASRVKWIDGSVHPMNFPMIKTSDLDLLVKSVEMGYLSIRSTSFVSVLVHRSAIETYGLPIKDYFIWNDDVEYTARILRRGVGFLVPSSIVVHKTTLKYLPVTGAHPERFYYEVRNKLWMLRWSDAWSMKEKLKLGLRLMYDGVRYIYKKRFSVRVFYHILRGIKDGFFRAPKGNNHRV